MAQAERKGNGRRTSTRINHNEDSKSADQRCGHLKTLFEKPVTSYKGSWTSSHPKLKQLLLSSSQNNAFIYLLRKNSDESWSSLTHLGHDSTQHNVFKRHHFHHCPITAQSLEFTQSYPSTKTGAIVQAEFLYQSTLGAGQPHVCSYPVTTGYQQHPCFLSSRC